MSELVLKRFLVLVLLLDTVATQVRACVFVCWGERRLAGVAQGWLLPGSGCGLA